MLNLAAKRQRGIGLLELMLSLAIISVLLVMATRYYKSTNESQKISNAISIINGIAGAAATWINTNQDGVMSIATLADKNMLPLNFKDIKSTINPWGGETTVKNESGKVTIQMTGITTTSCATLARSIDRSTCSGTTLTVEF